MVIVGASWSPCLVQLARNIIQFDPDRNSSQHIERMIFHMFQFQNSRYIKHCLQKKAIIFQHIHHVYYVYIFTCDSIATTPSNDTLTSTQPHQTPPIASDHRMLPELPLSFIQFFDFLVDLHPNLRTGGVIWGIQRQI